MRRPDYELVVLAMARLCVRCSNRIDAQQMCCMRIAGVSRNVRVPLCLACAEADLRKQAQE